MLSRHTPATLLLAGPFLSEEEEEEEDWQANSEPICQVIVPGLGAFKTVPGRIKLLLLLLLLTPPPPPPPMLPPPPPKCN